MLHKIGTYHKLLCNVMKAFCTGNEGVIVAVHSTSVLWPLINIVHFINSFSYLLTYLLTGCYSNCD